MQQLAFPIQYIRQQAAAIDVDAVFSTTAARTTYLTNARRYPGMIVSDTQTGDVYMLNAAGSAWITIGGTGAGVASIGSSDGSLTFSASTGTVDAILNLAHVNTWTTAQAIKLDAQGASTSNALLIYNSTLSTLGAQVQNSPSLYFQGAAWKSNATAASQSVAFAMYAAAVPGAAVVSGTWKLQANIAGAGLNDVFTVDSSGNAVLTGSLSLGALSTTTVLLSLAGTTAKSSFRIPIGVAPTSPVQGDFWATSGKLLYRDGSVSYNLLSPSLSYKTQSANYTTVATDRFINCTANTFTVTLLASATMAPTASFAAPITIFNSGAGTITLARSGSDLIGGATSYSLAAGKYVTLLADGGTNYFIISNN